MDKRTFKTLLEKLTAMPDDLRGRALDVAGGIPTDERRAEFYAGLEKLQGELAAISEREEQYLKEAEQLLVAMSKSFHKVQTEHTEETERTRSLDEISCKISDNLI